MITKRSSRLTVPSFVVWAMAWPTALSHWYTQAVSIRRYPASIALATADAVWSACRHDLIVRVIWKVCAEPKLHDLGREGGASIHAYPRPESQN